MIVGATLGRPANSAELAFLADIMVICTCGTNDRATEGRPYGMQCVSPAHILGQMYAGTILILLGSIPKNLENSKKKLKIILDNRAVT